MRRKGHYTVMNGWIAELSDGTVVRQTDGVKWGDIRDHVVSLSLQTENGIIQLPGNMPKYIQRQSGSCSLDGSMFAIERQTIGFYDGSGKQLLLTADRNGNIKVEVS